MIRVLLQVKARSHDAILFDKNLLCYCIDLKAIIREPVIMKGVVFEQSHLMI